MPEDDIDIMAASEVGFAEHIKNRIIKDFADATTYMEPYHQWCVEMYGFYHNSQNFQSLKKKNKFPSTAIQEDVDLFVSDFRDKLFYNGRPARQTPRDEEFKADVEAKQKMMDHQDRHDKIYKKFGLFIKDCALYRMSVAQVDFVSDYKREWVITEQTVPAVALDPGGQPVTARQADELNIPYPTNEDGEAVPFPDPTTLQPIPLQEKIYELKDIPQYVGTKVKRIDPLDTFFTADKQEIDDEFPIMIRSDQSLSYFQSRSYFFQDVVATLESKPGTGADGNAANPGQMKRQMYGGSNDSTSKNRPFNYLEWQAPIDQIQLYNFLLSIGKMTEKEAEKAQPDVKVWAIAGMVDGDTLVQLRENPFSLNGPNIVIGEIASEEEGLIGMSLSQKIEAIQRAEDDMNGTLVANLKQSVNAWTIINKTKIVSRKVVTNEEGGVTLVNDDPRNVVHRVEQPKVAGDIYTFLGMLQKKREVTGGLASPLGTKGSDQFKILGIAEQALGQAMVRMRDYLKTFEDTFVCPLYEMRAFITATLVDKDIVVKVIGKKGYSYIQITPEVVRTPSDFICESSTRETNRTVIIQQMLQFIKLAPFATAAGQIVRFDKMLAKLAEDGFSMDSDTIKDFFPMLRMEADEGVNVDEILLNNYIQQQMVIAAQLAGILGTAGAGAGGGEGNNAAQGGNDPGSIQNPSPNDRIPAGGGDRSPEEATERSLQPETRV